MNSMNDITNIVSISQKIFFPEKENILKEHSVNFYPAISWNKKRLKENITNAEIQCFKLPFTLYESGISISTLCNYLGGNIKKDDFLLKKVFAKLRSFASQCADRVIADLCCQVIIRTIKDNSEHIIYFIEKSASDKMLGRLGSLYLDLSKVTICFLSYELEDMFTNIISSQTGKLNFDLHRLMTRENEEPLGPYPGSSEDSLNQTFFYKPSIVKNLLPLRLDIFAQGLTEKEIKDKCDLIIKNIFMAGTSEGIAVPIYKKKKTSPYVFLPDGFIKARDRWEEFGEDDVIAYDMFNDMFIKREIMSLTGKE